MTQTASLKSCCVHGSCLSLTEDICMLPIACCWSRSRGMLTLLQLLTGKANSTSAGDASMRSPGSFFALQIFLPSLGIRKPYCYGRIAAESYIHPQISKQQNISTTFIRLFHKHLLRAYYVSGYFQALEIYQWRSLWSWHSWQGQWEDIMKTDITNKLQNILVGDKG